jgi:hypothetical protein
LGRGEQHLRGRRKEGRRQRPRRCFRSATHQGLDVALILVIVEVRVLDGSPAIRLDTDLVDDSDTARASDANTACGIVATRGPEWSQQDTRNRDEQCETRGT